MSETSTVGGWVETLVKLFAVMPTRVPSRLLLATTVTRVRNREAAARKQFGWPFGHGGGKD